MYYNYYQISAGGNDESVTNGTYSVNLVMSSLQEVILMHLQELAYYMLELKKFGASNEIIKETIIEAISGLITNVDYNHYKFQKLIITLAQDLNQAKSLYMKLCGKKGQKMEFIKSTLKTSQEFDLKNTISKGERIYIKRHASFDSEQNNLFDVILFLVKNLCLKIIQIKSYKKDYQKAYDAILTLLNAMNFNDITNEKIKAIIEDCTKEYYNIVHELSDAQEEAYGKRESVYISFTPRNGKAILVSGIDMTQLEAVLEATKGRGVDVYTHGVTMLMAHTLEKFRKYPHLAGHFGKNSDTSLFDFAAFPGAILMTRYLFQKVEYLYRGRLFTTDTFAPGGIVKIKNHNFEPLIQAALKAKGFTKKQQEVILQVGFQQKELEDKIEEIVSRLQKDEIKHFYIIGLFRHENEYKEYFNKFLALMPKDCYALALSHEKSAENILHIDSFYDYLLIYKIFEKLNEIKPLEQLKITIFITKCDQYTITNIINFFNMGIKNVFLCKCLPSIINPSIIKTLHKTFGVKELTNPQEDLENTLA